MRCLAPLLGWLSSFLGDWPTLACSDCLGLLLLLPLLLLEIEDGERRLVQDKVIIAKVVVGAIHQH